MNILIIGDVVGNPGRAIMKKALPVVLKKYDVDYCIANVENAAGGFGVTKEICDEILDMGVDCMTSGNHIWDKREIIPIVDQIPQLLRPLNYPAGQPGHGSYVGRGKDSHVPVAVLNLSGRVFMNGAMDDPFTLGAREVETLRKEAAVIIVDMHAEASSEKTAMAYHLDGTVSAVVGTHTHVPTCDHRILPKGTAYLTEVGMVGPSESVIGIKKEIAIEKFLTQMPRRFEVAPGPCVFSAVLFEVDAAAGKALSIERLRLQD